MIQIIFLLAGAAVLTYISKYNSELVTINLGAYTISDIPLFYVILGSILVGLVFAYLMHLITSISTYMKLRGKTKTIKECQNEILALTKRVHQLELENEKLKHTGPQVTDLHAL